MRELLRRKIKLLVQELLIQELHQFLQRALDNIAHQPNVASQTQTQIEYGNCSRVSGSHVSHHHYNGVRAIIPWPDDGEVRLESGALWNSLGASKRKVGTIMSYGFQCQREIQNILGACGSKTADSYSDISLIYNTIIDHKKMKEFRRGFIISL